LEAVRAYELELELQRLRELRRGLEVRLRELENAEEFLSSGRERKFYRAFSDLLVEVTRDEAEEHVERTMRGFRREIERLKEREKEILEELAKLRAPRP